MAIRKQRTEIFVGLFVFFGLAVMGILILQFGRLSDRFREHYELTVEFPTAAGLRKNSPVKLGGQKVGYVSSQPQHNDDFSAEVVKLAIYDDKKIPQGSQFKIGTSGLMGDTFVDIEVAKKFTGEFVQGGAEIEGTTGAGLDELQNSAGDVLAEIELAVKDIRTAVASLNKTFENIETDVLGEENRTNIKGILADLKESSTNIKGTTEKLDPVVAEAKATIVTVKESLETSLEKANQTFDTATETLEKIKDTVSKADPALVKLEPTVEELKSLLQNANAMIDKIESGSGTTGALISDSSLRADLVSFADKLDRYGILAYPKDKSKPGSSSSSASASATKPKTEERKRAFELTRRK